MLRWLKILLCGFAVMALLLTTMPWWLGVAARPVAGAFGVTFAHYERVGYTRFRVIDLRVAQPSVTVTAGTAEAPTPLVWAWGILQKNEPSVRIENWRVETRRQPKAEPSMIDSPVVLHAQLQEIVQQVARWVPRAELRHGAIVWPGDSLTIAQAEWHRGAIDSHGLKWREREWDVAVGLMSPDEIHVRASDAALGAALDVMWQGTEVNGTLQCWEQPGTLRATFAPHRWWPQELTAKFENWDVAAEHLRLSAHYTRVRGDALLEWRGDGFTLRGTVQATPRENGEVVPFEARVLAQGDLQAVALEELHVNTPFATADLSAPATFTFDGQAQGSPATLTLNADLAKQPWLDLAGKVTGRVQLDTVSTGAKLVFQLQGSDVRHGDYLIPRGALNGELQWPRLVVSTMELELGSNDHISAHGAVDWRQRVVETSEIEARLSPESIRRWLPESIAWVQAEIGAQVSGSFDALAHQGRVNVRELRIGELREMAAEAQWQGEARAVDITNLTLLNDRVRLEAAAQTTASGLTLTKANLQRADGKALVLTAPVEIAWAPTWRMDALEFAGESSRIALNVTASESLTFTASAEEIDSAWVDAWMPLAGPEWKILQWRATGTEKSEVLHFSTDLAGEINLSNQRARLTLNARSDDRGIQLRELNVVQGERVLTQVAGRLPVSWRVRPDARWQIEEDGKLELALDSAADSPLWAMLAAQAGIELEEAVAHAKVEGTLRKPHGELRVTVGHLRVPAQARWKLPDLDQLELFANAERGVITVESLSGSVAGQTVRAHGRLPMGEARWTALWQKPESFDWNTAEGRVEIVDADLAPLARRIEALPVLKGRLAGEVDFQDGRISGNLRLIDATSRPLGGLGLVQDINADLALENRRLEVHGFTGHLGGERVSLQGAVIWPQGEAQPRLDLALRGNNLPLVRQTGLLIRSDLDLTAKTGDDAITRLAGTVKVHDSLILADLTSLLPTGRQGVARQAPYFAVEAAPFRDWELDVNIDGPGGVRMRTAVFKGTASPQFHLTGTLGEPRAIGELTVEDAKVLFPFATFTVQLGVVRLRASNPHEPEITLNAISYRHDYELRLSVTGKPESPSVVFTSNPSLDTAQVILMVMTGESPAGDSVATTGTQRLTRLGTYLGRGLFGGLDGDESRLEIVSGERTSEQGRETYQVEYRFNDRWRLTGEYDEYDDYNVGLKWRVYTQESEPRE